MGIAKYYFPEEAVRTSMAEWQEENTIVDMPLYAIGQIARII